MPTVSEYTERVSWDGRHDVDRRTYNQLKQVEALVKHPIRMPQGSWSFSPLSAGTHGGPGAADVVPTGPVTWRQLETAMRCVGLAAWFRPWPNNYHCHGISIGNPHLPWLAALQVNAYKAGFDGLGGNGRGGHDSGTRLYTGVTWESYLAQHQGPNPQQPDQGGTVTTGTKIGREKDQRLAKGWQYLAINDKGDVSFGTGPGKLDGTLDVAVRLPPGQSASIRWVIDDIDDRSGRRVKTDPTHTIATFAQFGNVSFTQLLGSAPKGQSRRLRAQIHSNAGVVVDHVSVTYLRET